ncbi:hypothetical protein PG988_003474 [Apiospora saccharicola]
MELLSLPGEILHLILVQSVLCRGLKRALRLRLVCKTFDKIVYYPALFESHLLDHEHLRRRHCRGPVYTCNTHDHGVAKLWHDYLVYRVLRERDPAIGRFVELRELAQTIVDEAPPQRPLDADEWDLRHVVDILCWFALESGVKAPGGPYENWRREEATDLDKLRKATAHHSPSKSRRLSLLAAATLFDLGPLVTALLAEGHSPRQHCHLLPPATQLAAQTGNVALLDLFLAHAPPPPSGTGWGFEAYAVYGAAVRGDLEVMQRCFPAAPQEFVGSCYGFVTWRHDASKALPRARRVTTSPEVYEYLTNAWSPGLRTGGTPWYADLVSHAGRGNVEMVKYLLDVQGLPVDEKNGEELESALERACRCGQDEVVELLLARGADPDFTGHALWGAVPLRMAASGGHVSIVRKLLDHGARLENSSGGPGGGLELDAMHWAFLLEQPEMIALLLEHGATIRKGEGLATTLLHLGYESMLDVARKQHGLEPNPVSYGLRLRWIDWPENAHMKANIRGRPWLAI